VTTAEALEGIADTGLFEILGIRALKRLHPECACLEHLGVNAQGKPVPGPIDGFGRVPDTKPSRYIAAAFTTAGRDKLRQKWYADEGSDSSSADGKSRHTGDLIKACRRADTLRAVEPESSFTVYLCTNQRLDEQIMAAGYAIGNQRSVEVVFVGQSSLRDLLDSPEGQPLREEFLRIRCVSVSRELLLRLCQTALTQYQIDGLSGAGFIRTAAFRGARKAVASSAPVLALVGKPGAGKSVIGRSLLEDHAQNDGIGLWIPGDFLEDARSLHEAVALRLRQLHPYLRDEAGHETLALASSEHPLILVLDDPNRTDQPGAILRKIFGWGRNLWPERIERPQGSERRAQVKLVVPVWESQFSNQRRDLEGERWLDVVSVGPMQRHESVACLRNGLADCRTDLSGSQLAYIADRLGDDPILLSIFAQLARAGLAIDPNPILDDVIGSFVDSSLAQLALSTNKLKASYRSVLDQLARHMVVRKGLHPEWQEVREWMQPNDVSLLEDIAVRGDICHIANHGRRHVFEFRHDRLLEWQLSETILREFNRDHPDWDAVFDPYMAEALGRAMAHDSISEAHLDLAAQRLPVSLIAALAFLPVGTIPHPGRICRRVATWLKTIHLESPCVQSHAFSVLQNIVSVHVLPVTEGLAPMLPILFARLRNGDAASGAVALSLHEFYPSVNFSWLESLIAQAASRHGDQLVAQLAEILRRPEQQPDIRRGALVLAGYLAESRLADSILAAWESASDPGELAASALWAALRCPDPSGGLLTATLPGIFSVSDEPAAGGWSPRGQLFQDIGSSARHGFSLDVLSFLETVAERDEQYEPFVFSLFQRIDNPLCLEFVVRKVAKQAAMPVEPGKLSWAFVWESQWRRTFGSEDAPMPADCIEALWRLCQLDSPDWLRTYAFRLWVRFSGDRLWSTDLPADLSEPEEAVWQLARRGDKRVAERVLQALRSKPGYFYAMEGLWLASFEPALNDALKAGDAAAIHALRDVPPDVAERAIIANWEAIRDRPFAVAAALYVAKASTIALAEDALRSDPEPASKLRHAGDYLGFQVHGYSDRITSRHLDIIRPWLVQFGDHDLAHIGAFCRQHGYGDWARESLVEVCRCRIREGDHAFLERMIRQLFPNDAELVSDLDGIAADEDTRAHARVRFWADQFTERSDDPSRMLLLLMQWLGRDPAVSRFKIAARAMAYHGRRSSLQVLRQCSSTAHWPSLEQLYRDAEYGVMQRSLL
jgi:hypothetical protein